MSSICIHYVREMLIKITTKNPGWSLWWYICCIFAVLIIQMTALTAALAFLLNSVSKKKGQDNFTIFFTVKNYTKNTTTIV